MQGILGWENFVLGRWSKTWQQVQRNYYNSISCKRSPRRWTVAMICKMIGICWDMWDYRNELIHGKGGFYARAHNQSLDSNIRKEFWTGGRDLLLSDKYLFFKYNLPNLINYNMNQKQDWLRQVRKARAALNATPIEIIVVEKRYTQSTLNWCKRRRIGFDLEN